jgi:hypothetical protein
MARRIIQPADHGRRVKQQVTQQKALLRLAHKRG